MKLPLPRRYGPGARFYDVVSLERLLYRPGRAAAVELLRLGPGDRVLDVGCGTGLNFLLLVDAVGPDGLVVGLDSSRDMLVQAERRIATQQWPNVTLVRGDAGRLSHLVDGSFDAVLFTYSLAIIGDWQTAWAGALQAVKDGGRVAVADTALPEGAWRLLSPAAALLLRAGGVKHSRRVWERVLSATTDTTHLVFKAGHVHVAAGTATEDPDGPDCAG